MGKSYDMVPRWSVNSADVRPDYRRLLRTLEFGTPWLHDIPYGTGYKTYPDVAGKHRAYISGDNTEISKVITPYGQGLYFGSTTDVADGIAVEPNGFRLTNSGTNHNGFSAAVLFQYEGQTADQRALISQTAPSGTSNGTRLRINSDAAPHGIQMWRAVAGVHPEVTDAINNTDWYIVFLHSRPEVTGQASQEFLVYRMSDHALLGSDGDNNNNANDGGGLGETIYFGAQNSNDPGYGITLAGVWLWNSFNVFSIKSEREQFVRDPFGMFRPYEKPAIFPMLNLHAQIFAADEATPLTDEVVVATIEEESHWEYDAGKVEFLGASPGGQYMFTPDRADFDETDQLDVRILADIRNPYENRINLLVGRWASDPDNDIFTFVKEDNTGGPNSLAWRHRDQTNQLFRTMFSDSGLVISGPRWYRVVVLANNGSGNAQATFYISDDPIDTNPAQVSWTQWGAVITTPMGSGLFQNGTNGISVGGSPHASGESLDGCVYYAEVRTGSGGVQVLSPDWRNAIDSLLAPEKEGGDGQGRTWWWEGAPTFGGNTRDDSWTDYVVDFPSEPDMGYVVVEGSNDYATTPDAAAFDTTGDVDVRCLAYFHQVENRWQTLVGRWQSDTTNDDFVFGSPTLTWGPIDGLFFNWRDSGGIARTSYPTTPGAVIAGAWRWYRAVLDLSEATDTVTFYISDDPPNTDPNSVVWQQFDTTSLGAATSRNTPLASQMVTGGASWATSEQVNGRVAYSAVHDGIDGSIIASCDFRYADVGKDAQGNWWSKIGDAFYVRGSAEPGYMLAPGETGDFLRTSTSPSDITGPIDLRADVVSFDWRKTYQTILSRDNDNTYYLLMHQETTGLRMEWADSGGTFRTRNSVDHSGGVTLESEVGIKPGDRIQIRATLDPNVGGNSEVNFYYRTGPIFPDLINNENWIQLGTTATLAAVTGLESNSIDGLHVGKQESGREWFGKIYQTSIMDGINGTIVHYLDHRYFDMLTTGGMTFTKFGNMEYMPSGPRVPNEGIDMTSNKTVWDAAKLRLRWSSE